MKALAQISPLEDGNITELVACERPTLQTYERVSLHRCVAALIVSDVVGSILFAGLIFGIYAEPLAYERTQLWAGIIGFMVAWGLAANSQQLYRRRVMLAGLRTQFVRAAATVGLTFSLILLLAFGLRLIGGFSRLWLCAWAASALVWVTALRFVWHRSLHTLLTKKRCFDRALVLIGPSRSDSPIGRVLEEDTAGEVRVVATAPIPGTPNSPPTNWIEMLVRSDAVDRVFIVNFEDVVSEANALLARLARLAVDVTLVPNFEGLRSPVLRVDRIGMHPVVDVNLIPMSAVQAMTKRTEDLFLAGLVFTIALPTLALIAIAIKLDSPGPVFFRQWRAGYHDRPFRLWKFRTMYHDMRDENSTQQTARADSRVTRIGRFLRRTSLDELPQLINVLRGEMSIVGPRPHALGMTAVNLPLHQVTVEYSARHRVKPGITGWAQVNGCRGEIQSAEKLRRRVALDCEYIESWSLGFDLWVILRTLAVVFTDQDAY